MATIDLTKLNNITPLDFNVTGLNSSDTAIEALQTAARDNVGNFWFYGAILLVFIMLIWFFYRRDGAFLLDIVRATLTSAGWCFFISAAFLLSGWITTVMPLIWFGNLILITFISIQKLKSKGL